MTIISHGDQYSGGRHDEDSSVYSMKITKTDWNAEGKEVEVVDCIMKADGCIIDDQSGRPMSSASSEDSSEPRQLFYNLHLKM